MKDKDFDEIGKRLYDMEADPPQDGWDKLYGGLRPVPPPRGKQAFFRRHWWKPFVLIIPLATYYFVSDSGTTSKIAASSSPENVETTRGLQRQDPVQHVNPNTASAEESYQKSDSLQHNSLEAASTAALKESHLSGGSSVTPREIVGGNTAAADDQFTAQPKNSLSKQANNSALKKGNSEVNGVSKSTIPQSPEESPRGTVGPQQSVGDHIEAKTNEHPESSNVNQTSENLAAVGVTQGTQSKSELVSSGDRTSKNTGSLITAEIANATPESSPAEASGVNKSSAFAGPPRAPGLGTTSTNAADSLTAIATIAPVKTDTAGKRRNDDAQERTAKLSPWRVSLGITPEYVTKTVKPMPNDEVMMFLNSGNSTHSGLVASMGIGRALTNNFYVDLQFSMQKSRQDISYSYSTGSVDTLVARRQSDGTIIVSPVYDLSTAEIRTNYTYGGMRLSGTYYFLYNERGRFNLTAGAALNYLLSAKISENSNGEWVDVSDDFQNKTTYSLSVSGGYSFLFRKGWELMINPVLTYYPSNEKIRDLPFHVQRKSYGLNFTLLKNFSSGK